MQLLKTISLSLILAATALCSDTYAQVNGQVNATAASFQETPANTIIIKSPAANDPATFFSTSTIYTIYIYKPGDLSKIVSSFSKNAAVESCTKVTANSDYHELSLTLKATKDKMWFISLFKAAGLNKIKINNNPITELEKM